METLGIILLILAIVLGVIGLIAVINRDNEDIAFGYGLLTLLFLVAGLVCIWSAPKEEKDDEYVTVVTSDYKVLDQSQIYITGEDTVIYKKYIIKYKK